MATDPTHPAMPAEPSDRAGPASGNSQMQTPSPKTGGLSGTGSGSVLSAASGSVSRHSPVPPLPPLEFLQNHRRGSITDPSLHTANNINHLSRTELGSSAQPLPISGYRFGEGSRGSDTTLPHFRQLLRSPSAEADSPVDRKPYRRPQSSGGPAEPGGDLIRTPMDVEPHSPPHEKRLNTEHIDLNARRPSIAGIKRKLSSDRDIPMASNGDVDPHLIGPGVANIEPDGRLSKRRGSTFDSRIGQLTLDERRGSVDARAGPQPWWPTERRDSTTSMVSANTPLTGYSTPSSGLPGDSPHGRPPASIATFAWPVNPHLDQPQGLPAMQNEGGLPPPPHYEPGMIPPVTYSSDRRMSAPVISTEGMSAPSSGPARHRQRSRPASRARARDSSAANDATHSPSTSAEDGAGGNSNKASSQKDSGPTPYSRSPELRVSHKLAERKRRKEMKELFDELRDQLPADRGMKASKWEILSKAIDFIGNLKQNHQEMAREIEMLRHELDAARQGIPPFGPGGPHPVVYPHGPPVVGPYPPPPGPQPGPPMPHAPPPVPQHPSQHPSPQHPPLHPSQHPPQHPSHPPLSRPGSSQASYPPNAGPPPQNGTINPETAHTS
ncbi:hypothetical protein QCA50_000448 [Cerrena zonata]|uniref:BHLH domain-containing protein n=1 Tax=Cerrena zonata TaxID=2478898 RepID=A0AAW0GX38_9APHY